jgi:hypothetical protein
LPHIATLRQLRYFHIKFPYSKFPYNVHIATPCAAGDDGGETQCTPPRKTQSPTQNPAATTQTEASFHTPIGEGIRGSILEFTSPVATLRGTCLF